jgi:hypothetical protein
MLKPISVVFLLPLLAFASPDRGSALLGKLPMRFEANAGQWPSNVKFASRSAERQMVLHANDVLVGGLRLRPVNSNSAPRIEGVGKLRSGATYMLGQDRAAWRGNVPSFSAVAYRGVYPGIDLIYKGTGRRVEYDFVLAPHADPRAIRMEFGGASRLAVAEDGSLVAAVDGKEELRQQAPFAYQEDAASGTRTQVAAQFRLLEGNQVAFTLGEYDRSRALTIDPVLIATYFGGDAIDVATAVAVDSQNQVWVAGYTNSTTLPLAGNPYSSNRIGNTDIFVAKFNPNVEGADSLVWSTYFGGDGAEKPNAMALTTDGFLYLTGETMSANFPLGGSPAQNALKGDTDAFLVRLSRSQQGTDALWYATYLGGDGKDYGLAVTVDAQNQPYIAGYSTTSEGFTFAGGSFQTSVRGGYDAFFAAFSPDGTNTLRYSTFLGGGRTDVATGIAVDRNGIVHLTGYTMSEDFPYTDGAYRTAYAGRGDIFYARADITKPGLDGYLYGTYIGGSDADLAYGMVQDATGLLYVTGYTFSSDFPIFGDALRDIRAGSSDVFLLRIDPAAPASNPITYSTYLGGSGSELAYGISIASSGRVALTGYTDSTDFPAVGGALQPRSGGAIDAFVAIVDFTRARPTLLYSSYVGGDSPDYGYQVAQDNRGNVYVVGSTTSRRVATPGVFQPDLSKYTDAFMARVNLCENAAVCEAQGLTPSSAKPGVNTAAQACVAPGGPSLSMSGTVCVQSAGGATICTRKVCSADLTQ